MTREEAIILIERAANELREMMKTITMPTSAAEQLQQEIDAHEIAISALRQQEHFREVTKKVEPLTNAQKIRAMSDEELCDLLDEWWCMGANNDERLSYADERLAWLQQPAEEDKHENLD